MIVYAWRSSIEIIENVNLFSFHSRLTDLAGNIHDGVGNYSVGVKCSWLIDARDHQPYGEPSREQKKPSIRLHLEEFATECGWDHLYVFDGDSVESPLLAVFRWVPLLPLVYLFIFFLSFSIITTPQQQQNVYFRFLTKCCLSGYNYWYNWSVVSSSNVAYSTFQCYAFHWNTLTLRLVDWLLIVFCLFLFSHFLVDLCTVRISPYVVFQKW